MGFRENNLILVFETFDYLETMFGAPVFNAETIAPAFTLVFFFWKESRGFQWNTNCSCHVKSKDWQVASMEHAFMHLDLYSRSQYVVCWLL